MRRKDREQSREFALDIADNCDYAVMSVVDPEGKPYCVPLSIVREGEKLYFHCALEGFKTDCLRNSNTGGDILNIEDFIDSQLQNATIQLGNTGNIPADGELPDLLVQILFPIGNAGDYAVNIAQLGPAGTVGIDIVLGRELFIVFLIKTDGNNLLRLLAGEDPTVDQMNSQFSGATSGHGATLTCERCRRH